MGLPAIAAILAGSEVTGTLALAAITEIGTVMTVVGAVTGSKDLMKTGAVMGLVGGVGGAIASSSAAGETALSETLSGGATDGAFNAAKDSAAYDASVSAESALNDAVQGTGTTSFNEAAANAGNDEALQGIIGSQRNASSLSQPDVLSSSSASPDLASTQIQGSTPVAPDANTVTGAVAPTSPATPMGTDANAINTPGGSTYSNPLDQRLANGTATTPGGAPSTGNSSSFFDKFTNFVNNNKTFTDNATKLGLGLMSGAATSQYNEGRLAIERQKLAFGNSVGNFSPSNVKTTPGIIAGARTGVA